MKVNINGTWKDSNAIFVNINGVWKNVQDIAVKVGNIWVKMIEKVLKFIVGTPQRSVNGTGIDHHSCWTGVTNRIFHAAWAYGGDHARYAYIMAFNPTTMTCTNTGSVVYDTGGGHTSRNAYMGNQRVMNVNSTGLYVFNTSGTAPVLLTESYTELYVDNQYGSSELCCVHDDILLIGHTPYSGYDPSGKSKFQAYRYNPGDNTITTGPLFTNTIRHTVPVVCRIGDYKALAFYTYNSLNYFVVVTINPITLAITLGNPVEVTLSTLTYGHFQVISIPNVDNKAVFLYTTRNADYTEYTHRMRMVSISGTVPSLGINEIVESTGSQVNYNLNMINETVGIRTKHLYVGKNANNEDTWDTYIRGVDIDTVGNKVLFQDSSDTLVSAAYNRVGQTNVIKVDEQSSIVFCDGYYWPWAVGIKY